MKKMVLGVMAAVLISSVGYAFTAKSDEVKTASRGATHSISVDSGITTASRGATA